MHTEPQLTAATRQPPAGPAPSSRGNPTAASEKPLRVLFLNDTSRNGGPGKTLHTILKHLDPARIHRTVFVPREGVVTDLLRQGNLQDGGPVFEELFCDAGLVENLVEPSERAIERGDFQAPLWLQAQRGAVNVARATRFVATLAARVRRERYDVIFCNGTSACFLGGGLAKLTGTPVFWHVFYPGVGAAIRPLHRRLAQDSRVYCIACVSQPLTEQFAHCAAKVQVLHDAIDLEEFDAGAQGPALLRSELGLAPNAVVFGSQGRVIPRKGYLHFIDAAALFLARAGAQTDAHFVVLGDTPDDAPEDHLETCLAKVRALGLEARIHFIGFRRDVRPYVADFDVCVVPSAYEDPLPRAVMEAMAMRKPVVAFDVGGIGEMVVDGETGRLVSGRPPDAAGMARAMQEYSADPALRKRHGEQARLRITQEFEARAHAQAIDRLLQHARTLR